MGKLRKKTLLIVNFFKIFIFTATKDWGEKEIFCKKKASVGEKEGEGRGSGNRNYPQFVH